MVQIGSRDQKTKRPKIKDQTKLSCVCGHMEVSGERYVPLSGDGERAEMGERRAENLYIRADTLLLEYKQSIFTPDISISAFRQTKLMQASSGMENCQTRFSVSYPRSFWSDLGDLAQK